MNEKLWFKRKRYGWGWFPITWQGWAVTIGYSVLVVVLALRLDEALPMREQVISFWLPFIILTALLIKICYVKGESPKWQWGEPTEDE